MNFQMFNDPNGKTSSIRILTFMVVFIIMIVWAYISMKSETMISIDPGLIGVIGTLIGGKAVQSFAENGGKNEN